METVLGLDFGTQGVKGLIISCNGTIMASARANYGFCINNDGYIEQDPNEWVSAAIYVILEIKKQDKVSFDNICAIGISGQMHGIIPISDQNEPLYNCIVWCDTRCTKQIKKFEEKLDSDVKNKLRNPFVTAYSAGKILWIKENEPFVWNKTAHFLFCKDYIRFLMTGVVATDHSDASGSLLYDFSIGNWSSEACKALNIRKDSLPEILPSYAIAGSVTDAGYNLFNLKKGIPVVVGAGDLAASLLGSGIEDSNELLINLGTAGQILSLKCSNTSTFYGGYSFRFLDQSKDMTLYSIPSAAYCVKWFVEKICTNIDTDAKYMNQAPHELMHQKARESPVGSNGLIFAPYLSGTGSPYLDDITRGAWIGLDSSHNYSDLCRSILEGVAFGIRDCIECAGSINNYKRICFTGGGAKSHLWREILSDVCNYPISSSRETEATCIGAARLALCTINRNYNSYEFSYENEQPNSVNVKLYDKLYSKYKRIYPALQKITNC